MSDRKTYSGGCHCGAVRFEARVDLSRLVACNCSMCSKTGWLLAFAPAGDFTLLSGGDSLSDYQFHRRVIHHLFCRTCGIRAFSRGVAPDGTETVSVNARCVDGFDPAGVPVTHYDGRSA